MHTNQTQNTLSIDNPQGMKWPEEVKPYLDRVDWEKVIWNTVGFPSFFSSFSLAGNQLYFEKDSQGNFAVEKQGFTGEVIASTVLLPKDCDKVFVVVFELVFYKGVLTEHEVVNLNVQSRADYDKGFEKYRAERDRMNRIVQSWWFLYLYYPYYKFFNWIIFGIVFVVEFTLKLFIYLASFLIPFRVE